MYKEMVERKKVHAMVVLFIVLIAFICLSDIVPNVNVGILNMKSLGTICFTTIMIALCYIEFSKCKIKYRYSIVADEFIIHKVRGNEVTLLEDIKLRNINFIGKNQNYKGNTHISDSRTYMCSKFLINKFCCVYKVDDKFKKIYFQPSEGLMNKIRLQKEKIKG